ncbi:putative transmembrane protein, partial [Xanthomonas translucens DAR61454]
MRIERLDVVLRARSAWEAMELGSALVRRHAGAIWKPWLLISVPLFALLNLGAWAIDQLWLAGLLLWWLKPVLDRIPLFVISRGVFGDVPRVRDTLRAQLRWGWRPMFGYLTWRRLSPARTVFMPLELLEGASAEQQRQRRRTLGGAVYGHALLLASVCWHFEAMLLLACIAAIAMFVPVDLLPETARAAWALIGDENPVWADVGLNAFGWLATTLIEPFFVGAGFGLYLNRRTEIEAWDVEMALRRLRERLGGAAPLLLALVLLGAPGAALRAQTAAPGAGGP